MKFQFTTLDYQDEAVAAVVDALRDQPTFSSQTLLKASAKRLPFQESITANFLPTDHDLLLQNIQKVQTRNDLTPSPKLETTRTSDGKAIANLSIDMETGTGKTYVYLKTMLELEKHYGYKKFIVITPSIAIREGLRTALAITRHHFGETYQPFTHFAYDGKKLNLLRHFGQSHGLQLMILNIQAFIKDLPENLPEEDSASARKRSNIIHRAHDRFEGYSPLDLLRATNPVLILDEPQSIDETVKAKNAIAKLNPALILRYSATHKTPYNLLYRLDPVQAYERGIVKQISVASVVTQNYHNAPNIKLCDVKTQGNSIKARLRFEQRQAKGIKVIEKTLGLDSNLYELSNRRELYKGYIITEIGSRAGDEYVVFQKGSLKLAKGQTSGTIAEKIQKHQIFECVEQHFKKLLEASHRATPVKILSLFFIDEVANYRSSSDSEGLGKFAKYFEQAFAKYNAQEKYKNLIPHPVRKTHGGYFAQDKKGAYKDGEGNSEEQKRTYRLIMQHKEQLLDLAEPLQFIFSHSALREGWDNPNVFQICTLNATVSDQKKRQEIGRGLRLPVDSNGVRILERDFNRLTIITNESYEAFASALQAEVLDEYGKKIDKPFNIREAKKIRFSNDFFESKDFLKLWQRISPLTRYRINLTEQKIINKSVHALHSYATPTPSIVIKESEQEVSETGKSLQLTLRKEKEAGDGKEHLPADFMPELLIELQRNTSLPRHFLWQILRKVLQSSDRLQAAEKNPEAFLRTVGQTVREVMKESLVEGIRYTKTKKGRYEAKELFSNAHDHEAYRNLALIYQVQHQRKTLYDHIVCDSQPELRAAKRFDIRDDTKVFVKLPRKFVVRTPVGDYNPDWAIIKDEDQQIDLVKVIETKGSDNPSDRRGKENQKIHCAKQHFKALGVSYTAEVASTS